MSADIYLDGASRHPAAPRSSRGVRRRPRHVRRSAQHPRLGPRGAVAPGRGHGPSWPRRSVRSPTRSSSPPVAPSRWHWRSGAVSAPCASSARGWWWARWSIRPWVGSATRCRATGSRSIEIPADEYGRIDLDRYAAEVRVPGTLLASVQHANHELGTMQQIGEAARLAREAKVRFHTDACQTVGRLPVDVATLGRRPAVAVGPQVRRPARRRRAVRATRRRASPPIRAATIASASGARAWRTPPGSPRWRRRSPHPWPPWAMTRPRSGRSPPACANASRRPCRARACTAIPRTGPRTSCASAWTDWTPRP